MFSVLQEKACLMSALTKQTMLSIPYLCKAQSGLQLMQVLSSKHSGAKSWCETLALGGESRSTQIINFQSVIERHYMGIYAHLSIGQLWQTNSNAATRNVVNPHLSIKSDHVSQGAPSACGLHLRRLRWYHIGAAVFIEFKTYAISQYIAACIILLKNIPQELKLQAVNEGKVQIL